MSGSDKLKTDFKRKIVDVETLMERVGPMPRARTVVMCHGTFDIVHPGHLRHLMYAKERADILVASLTCDAHIYKANLRPFVPEELRAFNLAALEFVDFVIVDPNETPIENILKFKPDFFAKGFEYFESGVPPKTRDEMNALESYGGEMIFTPGDVVYSSSKLIESAAPKLGLAKLNVLMQSENVTFDALRDALTKMHGIKVHVLGDTIVDSYTYTRMAGGMVKTPTVSVQFEEQIDFAGGAAVVAKHMKSAGADVTFTTVMGEDELKEFVVHDLTEAGVKVNAIIDQTRPTTQKNSIICQGYHLLRVGKLDNRVVSERIVDQFCHSVESSNSQAYVFSDYRHGIFNRKTVPRYLHSVPEAAFRVADSQVASRWGNILEFQDFDLITPNEREARFALGDQDSVVRPLALELFKKSRCKLLMLTMGERGIMTYRANSAGLRAFFTVDSFVERLVDAVGAGDALLSYATLAMVATKNEVIASILGSIAAAIACEHDGNSPVKPKQVLDKLEHIEKIASYS